MKHWRDIIHNKMVHLMEVARASWSRDSLEAALTDCVYLGKFAGFRSIEWCQKSSTWITKVDALMDHLWTLLLTYTFVLEDFEFFTENKRQLLFLIDLDLSRVAYVAVRSRK
jgi:hypothetical protein